MFKVLALLMIAYVAYRIGFDPQFNALFLITALILLGVGAIGDGLWRRFRGR
jgi:hypothetical protein